MGDRYPTYSFKKVNVFEHHFFFCCCFVCFFSMSMKKITCEEIKTKCVSTVSIIFWWHIYMLATDCKIYSEND